jgi:hypothetical protein
MPLNGFDMLSLDNTALRIELGGAQRIKLEKSDACHSAGWDLCTSGGENLTPAAIENIFRGGFKTPSNVR